MKKKMILIIDNGCIYNEDGIKVGVLTNEGDVPEVKRTIEFGSEAAPALTTFFRKLNSRQFKRREAVDELEQLIKKYNDKGTYSAADER